MKNILRVLIISIAFSCTISYPMQQSINTQKIGLIVCVTAGCGVSLYIINHYKYSLLNWLRSFHCKPSICTQNDFTKNNEISLQNNSISSQSSELSHQQPIQLPKNQQQSFQQNTDSMILPNLSIKELQQNTEQYLQKEMSLIRGTTELHIACENNDIDAVALILQNTITNVNAKRDCIDYTPWQGLLQKLGETSLHIACQNNNIEIVKMLLKCTGIDTSIQNRKGDTAVHIACQNGNEEIVDLLLAHTDTKITLENLDGYSPLHIACKVGNNTKPTSSFFNKMSLIDKICDQLSPYVFPRELKKQIANFLLLCHKRTIVQKLLNHDASNLNTTNRINESAAYLSYLHNHKDIFSLLFSYSNIDLLGLLSLACERYDINMITQLLEHKNIKLNNSKPLSIACNKGYLDLVTLLLTYNKNNCMEINDGRANPLLLTCQKLKELKKSNPDYAKFVTIIKALLNDPAININIKDHRDWTVFHYVVSDSELLRLFLNKDNQFIDCPSECKDTPLYKAIQIGNSESVFLLLEHGASISSGQYTPLELACDEASREIEEITDKNIIQHLLEPSKETPYKNILLQLLNSPYVNKEIINSSDCLYKSNLRKNNTDNFIPKLLLSYGADPNKSNKKGSSPLLEVATYNLPLLNLFIDQYNGDSTQKDSTNQTVLYIAFMSKNIINANEINFFKNLKDNEKKDFMERELNIIANFSPKNTFTRYISGSREDVIKQTDDEIKLFNMFVAMCVSYGKMNLSKTLLNTTYENLHKRHQNFHSSKGYKSTNCMHPNENLCWYTHDKYTSYNGCQDCAKFFKYNELIMHSFIQHIEPTTTEQAADKSIALTYKEKPTEYYFKKTKDQKNQKKYLQAEIKKLNFQ
ncbi:MAG TPA: ankyrin repeat domain-containing protein [Candidatus Babeliales bacterium]|nr:ankyrin repeat domain-containing protein [Candidatus Babeliales bacterium]